jgi:hypothetical protein
MKRLILFCILLLNLSFQEVNSWIGSYEFNEVPQKAIAGYDMLMVWHLEIKQENKDLMALVEVNGQQTNMVIQAKVLGDNQQIKLVFEKGIDGFGYDNLKKGDVLFELKKDLGKVLTKWVNLKPILTENYQNNTICFELNK